MNTLTEAVATVLLAIVGVGLAAAVLIDATVVRGILVPAALALCGERTWYFPRWLDWLPGRHTLDHGPAGPSSSGGERIHRAPAAPGGRPKPAVLLAGEPSGSRPGVG